MKCLLLGGTHDGEWVDVDEGVPVIRMYVKQHFTPPYQISPEERVAFAQQEIYCASPLRYTESNGDTVTFPIFTYPSMTPTRIITLLLSGYRNGGQRG